MTVLPHFSIYSHNHKHNHKVSVHYVSINGVMCVSGSYVCSLAFGTRNPCRIKGINQRVIEHMPRFRESNKRPYCSNAAQSLLGSQQPRTARRRVYGEPSHPNEHGDPHRRGYIFLKYERCGKTPSTFTSSHAVMEAAHL